MSILPFHEQLIVFLVCTRSLHFFQKHVIYIPCIKSSKELERWLVCPVWFSAEGQVLSLNFGAALYRCPLFSQFPQNEKACSAQFKTLLEVRLYLSIHQWKKNLHWIAIKLSSQPLPSLTHLPHFLQFFAMYLFISCLHRAYVPYTSLIQAMKRAKFTTELLRYLKLFPVYFLIMKLMS